jgi:hypothetical protein
LSPSIGIAIGCAFFDLKDRSGLLSTTTLS